MNIKLFSAISKNALRASWPHTQERVLHLLQVFRTKPKRDSLRSTTFCSRCSNQNWNQPIEAGCTHSSSALAFAFALAFLGADCRFAAAILIAQMADGHRNTHEPLQTKQTQAQPKIQLVGGLSVLLEGLNKGSGLSGRLAATREPTYQFTHKQSFRPATLWRTSLTPSTVKFDGSKATISFLHLPNPSPLDLIKLASCS